MTYAVWNVSAGQDSTPASAGFSTGQYWYTNLPNNAFDGNLSSILCSYGVCNFTESRTECGQNTGVYVTAEQGPFVLRAFRVATGDYGSTRDPMTITIEGSNANSSALIFGSSWTLIYNGTSGLTTNPGRRGLGVQQTISNNTLAFASYRVLVVEKRSSESCVEYGEIQLLL